jgi:hypothetical protein
MTGLHTRRCVSHPFHPALIQWLRVSQFRIKCPHLDSAHIYPKGEKKKTEEGVKEWKIKKGGKGREKKGKRN